MTKQEAAEKVAKLLRLARDNANPHEAAAARNRAKKLIDEHGLSVEELSAGKKARAFDDLVAALRTSIEIRGNLSPGLFSTRDVVGGILSKIEAMSDIDKSKRLDEVAKLMETACLLDGALSKIGVASPISNLKKIFDNTLEAHGLERT